MTLAGVLVFLVLLLFSAQVLIGLYARSTLTAVAYDAARMVAGAGAGAGGGQITTVPEAEQAARQRLGSFGRLVTFTWREVDGQQVVLEVRATTPGLLPVRIAPLGTIDRTVVVRTERFR